LSNAAKWLKSRTIWNYVWLESYIHDLKHASSLASQYIYPFKYNTNLTALQL